MRNPELQKWVYTLLERPVGASLFYYHALFGLALLLAIGLSVVQTTEGDELTMMVVLFINMLMVVLIVVTHFPILNLILTSACFLNFLC